MRKKEKFGIRLLKGFVIYASFIILFIPLEKFLYQPDIYIIGHKIAPIAGVRLVIDIYGYFIVFALPFKRVRDFIWNHTFGYIQPITWSKQLVSKLSDRPSDTYDEDINEVHEHIDNDASKTKNNTNDICIKPKRTHDKAKITKKSENQITISIPR